MIIVWNNARPSTNPMEFEENESTTDLSEDHCISLLDFVEAAMCGLEL